MAATSFGSVRHLPQRAGNQGQSNNFNSQPSSTIDISTRAIVWKSMDLRRRRAAHLPQRVGKFGLDFNAAVPDASSYYPAG